MGEMEYRISLAGFCMTSCLTTVGSFCPRPYFFYTLFVPRRD